MLPLRPNPKTGYLETKQNSPSALRTIFDSEKKVKFLELAEEAIKKKEYPAIYLICDAIGISQRNFEAHLQQDPVFRADWNEINARLKSLFTCELANKAVSKYGVAANIVMLKYLENGTWNEKNTLIHSTDISRENTIKDTYIDAVDAEIVPNSDGIGTPALGNGNDSGSTT